MYSLTVKGKFDAAHHLPGYEGDCSRVHGHTWRVEVKVSSEVLNNQYMVMDFRNIKDAWKMFDHQDLNYFFYMPTAEALANKIYKELKMLSVIVNYVKVWESPDCCAEYSE